jgi:hypothetical protein
MERDDPAARDSIPADEIGHAILIEIGGGKSQRAGQVLFENSPNL